MARRVALPWRSASTLLLIAACFAVILCHTSVRADDDEIGDDIEEAPVQERRAAAPPVNPKADAECKKAYGANAEHDGTAGGGCRCKSGFVPVNGKCVREGKEAMREAYGERSFVPLIFVGLFFLILAGAVGYWAYSQGHDEKKTKKTAPAARREQDEDAVAAGGARPRGALARMRARRQAGDSDEDDDEDDGNIGGKKIGKKKAAKLEAKEEKRNMREAMEEAKALKKAKEEVREQERAEQEEAKRQAKLAKEEEERKAAEEIKKKEEEEFDKWKDMFETADDGAQADDDLQESQGMLGEFIDYLKNGKITPLDEVAAKYGLKAQEAVNRVEGLEAMGRITGLLDDRGKFIYIAPEEMEGVAKWIKLQGRVSIEDLAAESNRLVDMQPRQPAPLVIEEEVEGAEEAS